MYVPSITVASNPLYSHLTPVLNQYTHPPITFKQTLFDIYILTVYLAFFLACILTFFLTFYPAFSFACVRVQVWPTAGVARCIPDDGENKNGCCWANPHRWLPWNLHLPIFQDLLARSSSGCGLQVRHVCDKNVLDIRVIYNDYIRTYQKNVSVTFIFWIYVGNLYTIYQEDEIQVRTQFDTWTYVEHLYT